MPVRRKKAVERVETPVLASFYTKLLGAGLLVIGTAFFIGRSDTGPINVASTIQGINQERIDAGGNSIDSVATAPESLRNLPNGGLVPADPNAVPAPVPAPEPTPEESASTTSESEEDGAGSEDAEAGEGSKEESADTGTEAGAEPTPAS